MSQQGGNTSMKAITLWQPWASLVALGVKTIETRSWPTSYRGPLAIHAAAQCKVDLDEGPWDALSGVTDFALDDYLATRYPRRDRGALHPLPLGKVVATCTLVDCVPMVDRWHHGKLIDPTERCLTVEPCHLLVVTPGASPVWTEMEHERPYGDYQPGRWAWLLDNIEPLAEPVPARGRQQLWDWDADHLGRVDS